MKKDTYTGGEHYWISFYNGQSVVRREGLPSEDTNPIVYRGHYEDCVAWIDNAVAANYEHDLNL